MKFRNLCAHARSGAAWLWLVVAATSLVELRAAAQDLQLQAPAMAEPGRLPESPRDSQVLEALPPAAAELPPKPTLPPSILTPAPARPMTLPGASRPVSNAAAGSSMHEVWLFSTRHLLTATGVCSPLAPRVARFTADQCWVETTVDDFVGSADGRLTIVLIHGNRVTAEDSLEQGVVSFQRLVAEACDAPPVRFVIWSWPSETSVVSVIHDARTKACRTEIEARYVAEYLASLPSATPVTTIGFSYGARTLSGALHLLGGGSLSGESLSLARRVRQTPVRALFVAGGLDQDWLHPGGYHHAALSQVDRLFITYNPRDIVLRYYPLVCRRRGVEALGYEGLAGQSLMGPELTKIEQRNVTSIVQRRHAWADYLDTPELMAMLRAEVFTPGRHWSLARQ